MQTDICLTTEDFHSFALVWKYESWIQISSLCKC